MDRLTKLDRYNNYYTNEGTCRNVYSKDGKHLDGELFENNVFCLDGKAINKLGQLEDIEEELGIDLITLFKALKNGFYAITDEVHNTIGFIKGGSDFYLRLYFVAKKIYAIGSDEDFYFKDYGETWALTREELENE